MRERSSWLRYQTYAIVIMWNHDLCEDVHRVGGGEKVLEKRFGLANFLGIRNSHLIQVKDNCFSGWQVLSHSLISIKCWIRTTRLSILMKTKSKKEIKLWSGEFRGFIPILCQKGGFLARNRLHHLFLFWNRPSFILYEWMNHWIVREKVVYSGL